MLLEFLVLVTWLEAIETRGLQLSIVNVIRKQYFSDENKVRCGVPFKDPHRVIFKIYDDLDQMEPVNGVIKSNVLTQLKKNLVSLKDDPLMLEGPLGLEPLYKEFLKESSRTARRKALCCVMSIL